MRDEISWLKTENQSNSGEITQEKTHLIEKEILYIKTSLVQIAEKLKEVKNNERVLEEVIHNRLSELSVAEKLNQSTKMVE